jgi:hypothetical protein
VSITADRPRTTGRFNAIRGKAIILMFIGCASVGTIAWLGLIGWCGLALFGY